MKFLKISTVVVTLHVAVFSLLLLQSGCNGQTFYSKGNDRFQEHNDNFHVSPMSSSSEAGSSQGGSDNVYSKNSFNDDGYSELTVVSQPTSRSMTADGRAKFKPVRPTWDDVTDNDSTLPLQPKPGKHPEIYKVQRGDSLWAIARKHDLTVDQIAAFNGLNRNGLLKVGQEIAIPDTASRYYKDFAYNAQKAGGSTYQEPAPAYTPGAPYTVARGDTLSGIASRFGVKVQDIRSANNLSGDTIIAGKQLTIPGKTSEAISSASAAPRASASTSSQVDDVKGAYKVQAGDSLSIISRRFGVSVADLMTWNNISDARKLRAGQSLSVSGPASSSSQPTMVATASDFSPATTTYVPKASEPSVSMSAPFDPFDDDALFRMDEEVPVVSVSKE